MMTYGARALLLIVLSTCTAKTAARCLDEDQLKVRADRFQKRQKQRAPPQVQLSETQSALTCGQVVEHARQQPQHLHNRALSPWTYRVNRDNRRFPRDIVEARCLCQGCILQRPHEARPHEEHDYNSVPIYAHMLVLTKTRCAREPHKHRLMKKMLRVPVACTCAVPEYTSHQRPDGPG